MLVHIVVSKVKIIIHSCHTNQKVRKNQINKDNSILASSAVRRHRKLLPVASPHKWIRHHHHVHILFFTSQRGQIGRSKLTALILLIVSELTTVSRWLSNWIRSTWKHALSGGLEGIEFASVIAQFAAKCVGCRWFRQISLEIHLFLCLFERFL